MKLNIIWISEGLVHFPCSIVILLFCFEAVTIICCFSNNNYLIVVVSNKIKNTNLLKWIKPLFKFD
jgi:hypothetical protein